MSEFLSKPSTLEILIVDDSPTDRTIFKRFLTLNKAASYIFREAQSVGEALELVKTHRFDCILLDYDLPDGFGTDLIKQISGQFGKNTLPIVMLSGSGTIEIAIETIRSGAQDFLVKSRATAADLVRAVENAIDKVRLFQDKILAAGQIQVSEERYRLLFDNTPLPAIVYDQQTQEILAVNQYAARHYGYSRDEFLSMTFDRLVDEDYLRLTRAEATFAVKIENFSEPAVSRHRLKDGKIIDVEINCHDIDFQNRQARFVIVRDFTERKQAEEERKRHLLREQELREAAESANRTKDEFLAVLSHELRTPLNAMSGWAKILSKGMLDEAKTQKALEVIERNISLQNALIDDLLDISRIISNKIRLETGEVDFCKIVSEAVETARFAAEAKRITLRRQINTEQCYGTGDVFRLQQILSNLLTNAIKFTPEYGTITVELNIVRDQILISVKDTGVGIDEELLPHIFERFKQADGSTKRKFGGLGLGLAIAKSLVEMHGGRISAESFGENLGSQFSVKLPFTSESEKALAHHDDRLEDDPGSRNQLENVKIMLIDDEADSLELLNFVLGSHGAEVLSFQSGIDALENIESLDPDVLITDLSMPELDGFDLIARVRQLKSARDKFLPAIAMTAYASAEDRAAVYSAGFQMHIPKPVNIETVAEQIRQLLETVKR